MRTVYRGSDSANSSRSCHLSRLLLTPPPGRKWRSHTQGQQFARNQRICELVRSRHLAVVGLGSGGSAIADMAGRTGIGKLTLIDPEELAPENLGRHVLGTSSIGKPKVEEVMRRIREINPSCEVLALQERFSGDFPARPDVIASCVDSSTCESLLNAAVLRHDIPNCFGGCWHQASVGEIYYVVPGKTACLECYSGFRRGVALEPDAAKYWDPAYDKTQVPAQEGLWANILLIAAVQSGHLGAPWPARMHRLRAQPVACERERLREQSAVTSRDVWKGDERMCRLWQGGYRSA